MSSWAPKPFQRTKYWASCPRTWRRPRSRSTSNSSAAYPSSRAMGSGRRGVPTTALSWLLWKVGWIFQEAGSCSFQASGEIDAVMGNGPAHLAANLRVPTRKGKWLVASQTLCPTARLVSRRWPSAWSFIRAADSERAWATCE